MSWIKPVKKPFKADHTLRNYLASLQMDSSFTPHLIVWHNTAAPNIKQWLDVSERDVKNKLFPGTTRINNLESFFRDGQHWPSAPHWFVAPEGYAWAFTPSNRPGTHTPSWNGISIGIECVGDFSLGHDDDDSGPGLVVRNTCVILTAMLCERFKINPLTGIKLHKEDKATTHDCPGKDMAQDKDAMIQEVLEYMGHGGEHPQSIVQDAPKLVVMYVNTPGDTLNLRELSSASSPVVSQLSHGSPVTVIGSARNGKTPWNCVQVGTLEGWVAARYLKETKP